MSNSRQRTTVHSRVISAPAKVVYDLVAKVTHWPVIFEPSLHVQHLELDGNSELLRLWALVSDQVKTWTSRRILNSRQLHIRFVQECTQPPLASMCGEWTFRSLSKNSSEVVLTHHFTVVDGESLDTLTSAVDHNSESELTTLGRVAALGHSATEVVFSFEDTVRLDGAMRDAYQFVYRSDEWPHRLPHVSRAVLKEKSPDVQDMEMDTTAADGAVHTTRSIRLCFPHEQIVYKQLTPPDLLFGHSGAWTFTDGPDGAVATARHTVAINPDVITAVLGANRTLADARDFLHAALGANSRATLAHASAYARSQAALILERPGE